ncbi:AraC family transcriptional regulator, partial [Staphylococcus aureus]|nr:AraC family transcriptional regulator [Staphylococcus aureus]
DIAMQCGFSTTSYFIKLFKATYGMTPKQYQRFQLQS